jgi:hypothetical protein
LKIKFSKSKKQFDFLIKNIIFRKKHVEKCAKYLNGIPTEEWLATIITVKYKEALIGYSIGFKTDAIPTICVQKSINIWKLKQELRKHEIGILTTKSIGHLHYIYFLRYSNEN